MDTEILERSKAFAWLARNIKFVIKEYANDNYELTDTLTTVNELIKDIAFIKQQEWAWVAIEECPMSITNINVREANREEIQHAIKW